MKKVFYVIIITLISLLFILYSINFMQKHDSINEKSYIDNIYFTTWLGYASYSISNETGKIEIPYIDFNKNSIFKDNIKTVELLPKNELIKVKIFNILEGTSSNELDINTLSIQYDLLKTGNIEFKQIKINLFNNTSVVWDIGDIKVDILKINNSNIIKLGIRQIVMSDFSEYSFTLINNSAEDILVKGLVYNLPKGIDIKKLRIADNFDTSEIEYQKNNEYILKSKEKKVFSYIIENSSNQPYKFYLLKPLLRYFYNGTEYTMTLDSITYSGNFTEEVINQIKNNKYSYISTTPPRK